MRYSILIIWLSLKFKLTLKTLEKYDKMLRNYRYFTSHWYNINVSRKRYLQRQCDTDDVDIGDISQYIRYIDLLLACTSKNPLYCHSVRENSAGRNQLWTIGRLKAFLFELMNHSALWQPAYLLLRYAGNDLLNYFVDVQQWIPDIMSSVCQSLCFPRASPSGYCGAQLWSPVDLPPPLSSGCT